MSRCEACDGGWVEVSVRWVEHQAPWPEQPPERASEQVVADYAAAVEQVRIRRAALTRSVYPCKTCRPRLFYRWAGGHLDPDHDESRCNECQDVRRGRSTDPKSSTTNLPEGPNPEAETRRDIYQ